jgi:uncharacterized protein YjhX (UPF0386 family)
MSREGWTTKDGRFIKWKDMSDNHLLNLVGYMRKQANNEGRVLSVVCVSDDINEPDCDVDLVHLKDIPDYKRAVNEIKRRGGVIEHTKGE